MRIPPKIRANAIDDTLCIVLADLQRVRSDFYNHGDFDKIQAALPNFIFKLTALCNYIKESSDAEGIDSAGTELDEED